MYRFLKFVGLFLLGVMLSGLGLYLGIRYSLIMLYLGGMTFFKALMFCFLSGLGISLVAAGILLIIYIIAGDNENNEGHQRF